MENENVRPNSNDAAMAAGLAAGVGGSDSIAWLMVSDKCQTLVDCLNALARQRHIDPNAIAQIRERASAFDRACIDVLSMMEAVGWLGEIDSSKFEPKKSES